MGSTLNPFQGEEVAQLYSRGRPYYHERVLHRVQQSVEKTGLTRALDVACGTGLSTLALVPFADFVVGVDVAEDMVRRASINRRVCYAVAHAEMFAVW